MKQIIRAEFWRRIENSGAPDAFSPASNEFRQRLMDFAFKVKNRLRDLRKARETLESVLPAPPPPPPPVNEPDPLSPPATGPRTVILAQGTDDVSGSVEEVRRYLE